MHARFLTIAVAALAIAGVAAAQPAKPADTPKDKPSSRVAPVVLASAEQVVGTSIGANQPTATVPAKRPRAARVTTCRCGGDPQPQQEEQQ